MEPLCETPNVTTVIRFRDNKIFDVYEYESKRTPWDIKELMKCYTDDVWVFYKCDFVHIPLVIDTWEF